MHFDSGLVLAEIGRNSLHQWLNQEECLSPTNDSFEILIAGFLHVHEFLIRQWLHALWESCKHSTC